MGLKPSHRLFTLTACVAALAAAAGGCKDNKRPSSAAVVDARTPPGADGPHDATARCLRAKKPHLVAALREAAIEIAGKRGVLEGAELTFATSDPAEHAQLLSKLGVRKLRGSVVGLSHNAVIALPRGAELETVCKLALHPKIKGARFVVAREGAARSVAAGGAAPPSP